MLNFIVLNEFTVHKEHQIIKKDSQMSKIRDTCFPHLRKKTQ